MTLPKSEFVMFDILKRVPLFANLPEDDLEHLCTLITEKDFPADEPLFGEGEIGDKAYVIMVGEVDIFKKSGGQLFHLATRQEGEVIGEMSLIDQSPRFASGRTRTACKLLIISHDNLEHLLDTSPTAARVMLSTFTHRLKNTELILRQSERMAQLGTLTAGIAHELNNPAAAAQRGAEHLSTAIHNLQQSSWQLYEHGYSAEQWDQTSELMDYVRSRVTHPVEIDSLERSDREQLIESWLDKRQIENSWEYSPILVSLGYLPTNLEELDSHFPGPQLDIVVQWVCTLFTIHNLVEEINQGTSKIGEIVKSLKSYAFLDEAPVQEVDIHEGLENTLVMLRSKTKKRGIILERHFAKDLPMILAYGAELNQVWTNIIDNAIDAMDGIGQITISTRQQGDWIFVDIEDSGPGIPEDVQQKLFSPFFTTKPVGKGTGLGLNISYNIIQKHKGEITVFSRPGRTCFSVRLPLDFEQVTQEVKSLSVEEHVPDERYTEILQTTKSIAVVGISAKENAPAYTVPKYLQEHGYTIIPVNSKYDQVMGERAYPDLISLKNAPDVVLIFRRSDFVPEIVEQAIIKGARVIWLQEGIVNNAAAEVAKDAGLDIVMDTCMRKTHQRLFG